MMYPSPRMGRFSPALFSLLFLATIWAQADTLTPQIAVNEGKVFGLVEIHMPLNPAYANPFDPNVVTVQGHFQGPDGTVTDIDGFADLDYVSSHSTSDKWDHVAPQGNAYWAVRYAPIHTGSYTWWVTRKDGAGSIDSAKATFTIADDPTATGFIRIAPNRTHFQDDRGAAFFGIGSDIAWPTSGGMFDMERWFSELSQNGGNSARVWMTWLDVPLERIKTPKGGWKMPITVGYLKGYVHPDLDERTQNGANDPWGGPGRIDLANAWRYDHLLDLARKDGMRLMLCQSGGPIGWPYDPYNKANGGMLDKSVDFFSNAGAKAIFKQRLRYVVARYGWSSNVLAWELVNEVDGVGHRTNSYPAAAVAAWHKEMAQYLKQIDPNKHLVTTSVAYDELDSLFTIPEIDFAQAHLYNFQDSVPVVTKLNDEESAHFGKPHLIGEFGLEFLQQKYFGGPWTDPKGITIETGLWASMASPSAGTVWPWYWDNYIEPQHLWPLWKPVAQFAANVPWNKVQWKPVVLPKISYASVAPDATRQLLRVVPPKSWDVPAHPFKVGTDGSVEPKFFDLPLYVRKVTNRPPLTFQVNYPQSGQFQAQVRCVGKNGATLQISLDGKPLLTKVFPGGAKNFQFQFNGTYSIDVPAGPHNIQVANIAEKPEALFSAEYDFVNYLDPQVVPLRVYGMEGDDNVGIFYFYNQDYTWGSINAGNPVKPVAPSTCVIPGLKAGTYNVETWSPSEGIMLKQEQMTAPAEGLSLHLPQITNDLAIKILPVPNT